MSLHSCSSKAQLLLLTLDKGYPLTAAPPDLERGVAPLGPPAHTQPLLLGRGVAPLSRRLTECGPLEKEMANHFSIRVLRTPLKCEKAK